MDTATPVALFRSAPADPPSDEAAAAESAGLRYVSDDRPGITRRRRGKGFSYRDPDGLTIVEGAVLQRIRRLAIPPAWTDVWISPDPRGHIQATGRDSRGRKQYRYHPLWREVRDGTKFGRLIAFARALPQLRARIDADLVRHGLPREKVLAAVVHLLETTLIRVGNEEYRRANGSFGLTTLRGRHVEIDGGVIRFEFRGKGGKTFRAKLRDRRTARIVRSCQELPGQELFQYVDEDGARHSVDSADVNAYLHEAAGDDFTAKDFRTWAATVLGAFALRASPHFGSKAAANRNIAQAIASVASTLGNTVAVCRRCYVHPDIVNGYLDGSLPAYIDRHTAHNYSDPDSGLNAEETAVLGFLRQRVGDTAPAAQGKRRRKHDRRAASRDRGSHRTSHDATGRRGR